ncbi:hypothetical protein [Neobacillus drentensis]|uniref:hypothetical protein n=1 Tax=Neobacillus drentensis TaxID=220684 RepID=UPI002FFE0E4E
MNKLFIGTLAATLMFSYGIGVADAKGKSNVKKKKVVQVDKDRNGIPDDWQKRYHLGSGKSIATKDFDKDGLNNLQEYQLNLNPKLKDTDKDRLPDSKEDNDKDGLTNALEYKLKLNPASVDTNHNKIPDGDEDFDKDGVPNLTEVEFLSNPVSADSDKDGIKDGQETDKNGVDLSHQIKNLNIQIHTRATQAKGIHVHFNYRPNGKSLLQVKDRSGLVTKDKATTLVNQIATIPGITKDQIIALIKTDLNLTDAFKIKVELKYVNGKETNIDKEVPTTTPTDNSTSTDEPTTTSTDNSTSTDEPTTTSTDNSTSTDEPTTTPTDDSTTTSTDDSTVTE